MQSNDKITAQELQRELATLRAEYEEKLTALREEKAQGSAAAAAEDKKLRNFLREQEAWLNEYVEVRLFKDNEKYKDDVYVAINGKNCLIRRGVWTRIRRKFALLLDQSEIQDLRTAELMEREEGRFVDESRRRSV